jgi:Ran GTPase-activating protein (RanGAP) involved in mRNA processing and transport
MSTPETRTIVCAAPSQLVHELAKTNGLLAVIVTDEPRSLEGLFSVMPHLRLRAVDEVDLAGLGEWDREALPCQGPSATVTTISTGSLVPALYSALAELNGLTRLRLGKACLDQASGSDDVGKWDVDYLCDVVPQFKTLRALDLRGLDLTASDAFDILASCRKCSSLRELDLSHNSIHELSDVLEYENVVCDLESLNLSYNALGDFDSDSYGSDLTCNALHTLLTKYTSLCDIDLSCNAMGNREGKTIACALRQCTHLRELNLAGNDWDEAVDASIKAAWQDEPGRLFL